MCSEIYDNCKYFADMFTRYREGSRAGHHFRAHTMNWLARFVS